MTVEDLRNQIRERKLRLDLETAKRYCNIVGCYYFKKYDNDEYLDATRISSLIYRTIYNMRLNCIPGTLHDKLNKLDINEFVDYIHNKYNEIYNKKEEDMNNSIFTNLEHSFIKHNECYNAFIKNVLNTYQKMYGHYKSIDEQLSISRILAKEIIKEVRKCNNDDISVKELLDQINVEEFAANIHDIYVKNDENSLDDLFDKLATFYNSIFNGYDEDEDEDEDENEIEDEDEDEGVKNTETKSENDKVNSDNFDKNNNHINNIKIMNETPCKCFTEKHVINENDDNKTIKILMPGVSKKNINLEIVDDALQVSLKDIVNEAPFVNPNMSLSFGISDDMDIENMSAKLELGILTINIPKIKKEVQRRTITIL